MKLSFKSSYRSIKQFPEIEIPEFTLITGENGVGKTHLLKAIQSGNIAVDIAPNPTSGDVAYFDWNMMVPKDEGAFDIHAHTKRRSQLFTKFSDLRGEHGETVITAASQSGLPLAALADVAKIAAYAEAELIGLLGSETKAKAAATKIAEAAKGASARIQSKFANKNERTEIAEIAREAERSIVALRQEDFYSDAIPSWGSAKAFQQSFGRLFSIYRDLWRKNQIRQWRQHKGQTDIDALTDEEFIERYNIPPWDFVNGALQTAGLDFEIDFPDEVNDAPYQPKLSKRSTGTEISFSDLSSGEQILMSFALCLYYSEDDRQISNYPKLLLFDEIDAPLHPSMARTLIQTITDTLVGRHSVSVIAATHAPSTVAMAPDESIHVMLPDQPGLHSTSKAQALNILTVGVPTLAISFEGRRQVMVESENDARVYAALYDILKSCLASERSLEFIGTGTKSKTGDVHTGCDVVRSIVTSLSSAGNKSVFGLIDWDGKNNPTERIEILAHSRRNGIENAILDPLLVAALLLHHDWNNAEQLGIPKAASYRDFLDFDPVKLQPSVDRVQALVLGNSCAGDVSANYIGQFNLKLRSDYLTMDDHSLENRILDAFPSLQKIATNHAGALMLYVAQNITNDQQHFLPQELFDAFQALLTRASH